MAQRTNPTHSLYCIPILCGYLCVLLLGPHAELFCLSSTKKQHRHGRCSTGIYICVVVLGPRTVVFVSIKRIKISPDTDGLRATCRRIERTNCLMWNYTHTQYIWNPQLTAAIVRDIGWMCGGIDPREHAYTSVRCASQVPAAGRPVGNFDKRWVDELLQFDLPCREWQAKQEQQQRRRQQAAYQKKDGCW